MEWCFFLSDEEFPFGCVETILNSDTRNEGYEDDCEGFRIFLNAERFFKIIQCIKYSHP